MLEPCIVGFYLHIFKARLMSHVNQNIQILKHDAENPQDLNSKSLTPNIYPIWFFLASREMLGVSVLYHLQFDSLAIGLHHPNLLISFSPAPMNSTLLAAKGSEETEHVPFQTPLWS